MYANYIKLALRNMAKNRLYAFINIVGLAIGLAVFLFGMLLAGYERDHDSMFSKRDQIYTAGSVFAEGADIGVLETDSINSAMGPLLESNVDELEAVARTVTREFLVTLGGSDDGFYHDITFADPEFTQIFDFTYLAGDGSVLADPRAVILSKATAEKYFGRSDVVNEVITLDHEHDFIVKAVIEDIPRDSHFNSSIIDQLSDRMFAQLDTLAAIEDFNFDEDWSNLSLGDRTYMLLPPSKSEEWLSDQVNDVFRRNAVDDRLEFVPELRVRPLVQSNTFIWDAIGIPALTSIQILGLLVLIVACVNYTNLATAQSMGRAREVGLRKTFGAGQSQLLTQFMVESLTIACVSMLLALACLELLIPAFNEWSSKSLGLNYRQTAPYLILTVLGVGTLAGAYPAWMITRAAPIDSLHNSMLKGNRGGRFRSLMIGLQFCISVFMLASVLVMFFQNRQIEQSSNIFPKDTIVVLDRAGVEDITQRHPTLRRELMSLPGVDNVTFTSQVPFEQSNSSTTMARTPGDEASGLSINQIRIDEGFLETFDIPLLAGRAPTRDLRGDVLEGEVQVVNVLINERAALSLGFPSPEAALGESVFQILGEVARADGLIPRQYNIIGLLPDQNYLGLHNKIKPTMFLIQEGWIRSAAIRVRGENLVSTIRDIERVWSDVIPDYPIQRRLLDDVFNEVYVVFRTMNTVLAGFAVIALSLALIGLFGLAAFMAERRTREIGIRKVLGAKVSQIVRLLVWQFSIPVLWSLLAAMPLAYAASGLYLNFFDERITMLPLIIALASALGLATAWLIVAVHAVKIATASPIYSLRYE